MKNGEFVDTYDRDRRVNREKSREKLDLEMIGLVKKKKKKSNQATKRKFSGLLMRSVGRTNELKRVLKAVRNGRQNVKPFKSTEGIQCYKIF